MDSVIFIIIFIRIWISPRVYAVLSQLPSRAGKPQLMPVLSNPSLKSPVVKGNSFHCFFLSPVRPQRGPTELINYPVMRAEGLPAHPLPGLGSLGGLRWLRPGQRSRSLPVVQRTPCLFRVQVLQTSEVSNLQGPSIIAKYHPCQSAAYIFKSSLYKYRQCLSCRVSQPWSYILDGIILSCGWQGRGCGFRVHCKRFSSISDLHQLYH